MLERIGLAGFEVGLGLLPRDVRRRIGQPMRELFAERQRQCIERGWLGQLARLWMRETVGLCGVAFRARVPDRWTVRTTPNRPKDPHTYDSRASMDSFTTDLKFALRTFAKRPLMTLLAAGTLSLGIGTSTAMFSVTESVLLTPPPYPNPENLYSVYPTWPELAGHPTLGDLAERGTWSWPEFFQVELSQQVFSTIGAWQPGSMTWSGEGRPERVSMAEATRHLFPLLGVRPALGRLFVEADGTTDTDRVILLTAGYWRDRFGADPSWVGRAITLDSEPYTIVGVLPDEFEITGSQAQLWKLKVGSPTDPGLGNHGGVRAMARLVEGVGPADARTAVARILQEELPESHGEHGASVFPRSDEETRAVRPALLGLLAASALLLLVACGNVAALLLGAGIDRERELALRGAVGASRGRIARQMLTESVLLAGMSAILGVALAGAATRGLVYLAPAGVPRLEDAAISAPVLAFAILLTTVCGLSFGSIPALSLSTVSIASSVGSTRTTSRRRARLQNSLVVAELVLATVLLVGGGLLARSVSALDSVDLGFDGEGILVASIAAPSERFRQADGSFDSEQWDQFHRNLLDQIRALPGVTAASIGSSPPLFGWRGNNGVVPEGWDDPLNAPVAERRLVEADYLDVLGIQIVEGRGFDPTDDLAEAAPVVIVSEGLAAVGWPGESAVGKSLNYWGFEATVIGVAANIRDEELQRMTELAYYAPGAQTGGLSGPLVVRVSGDPEAIVGPLRERIWEVDPDVPITRVETLQSLMEADVAGHRYRARLIGVFAALAALFSLMGVYGVSSRSVARRTQELGVRLALGARPAQVRGMVTLQAGRLGLWGALGGVAASLTVAGAIERFLWGVSSTDVTTVLTVSVALPLTAALAAFAPARRATRVSPLEALRPDS